MRVLMLDFDGVLHHSQGSKLPEFSLVPRLAAALSGHECQIVISSTWREHYSLAGLRALVTGELEARVIDVLGPDGRGPHVRYQNIIQWVGRQRSAVDWRALDDAASEFPARCPQLILCDGMVGVS